jgi:hypothetical protein
MNIKQFTKKEMEKIQQKEKEFPIKKKWFKHKDKEIYQYQLNVFGGDFALFNEVEE